MLNKFYENINLMTNMVVYGVNETMEALEKLAIKTLIIYDKTDYFRVELREEKTQNNVVKYLRLKDIEYKTKYSCKQDKKEYIIMEYESLVDWISERYLDYKSKLYLVTDKSPEGS